MEVIHVVNVNEALPVGLKRLVDRGVRRDSRNGPVRVMPCPVTTVYDRPLERVLFWKSRDANPFLHVYESFWMLAGRNDVLPLLQYSREFEKFHDHGTMHGAYGRRWRGLFETDQLQVVARRLREMPEDRRCVIQMWDTVYDLDSRMRDVPCNVTATVQRDADGRLDLTVFCRSNDVIWGAYGANAVHFSFLQEYLALLIGCDVGRLYQVSVNYHAYEDVLERTLPVIEEAKRSNMIGLYGPNVRPTPLLISGVSGGTPSEVIDGVTRAVDTRFLAGPWNYWTRLLYAHYQWKSLAAPERFERSLETLSELDQTLDWTVAATQWIERRRDAWQRKMDGEKK